MEVTNKHEVIAAHRAHQDWGAVQIADHLGCGSAYVRATAGRNSLTLPRSRKPGRLTILTETVDGILVEVDLLQIAIAENDPPTELRVRCNDIRARLSTALAKARERNR